MTATDRTIYWREYARRNVEKRKAIKAAWRARNKAKIAAYARTYRAEHPVDPDKPRAARPAKADKDEALISLKERFAAFRARQQAT